jgi:hypothetical protein
MSSNLEDYRGIAKRITKKLFLYLAVPSPGNGCNTFFFVIDVAAKKLVRFKVSFLSTFYEQNLRLYQNKLVHFENTASMQWTDGTAYFAIAERYAGAYPVQHSMSFSCS